MPLYTQETAIGVLKKDARFGHVIETGGGGFWIVTLPWRGRRLLGRHVRATGIRTGFNELDVECIEGVEG